jgi:hypothetical protein
VNWSGITRKRMGDLIIPAGFKESYETEIFFA